MAKQIKQLRLIGNIDTDSITFDEDAIWSNNLIAGKYVVQLGIYALPGTQFLLNQDDEIDGEDLQINNMGIFQVDVEERPITSLKLKRASYDKLRSMGNHMIVIDYIYEGGLIR